MILFDLYAAYLALVKKYDIAEIFLMGASAFVALSISLLISAKKIESQKIGSDMGHSVMLNIFCYYLFGLIFMIFEPLQRVDLLTLLPMTFKMLGLTLGMTVFYFLMPMVIFGIWWMVPVHLYWMKIYRATSNSRQT